MTHLINPETDYEALTLSNKYLTELKKLISCIANTLSRLKMWITNLHHKGNTEKFANWT